MPLLRYKPTMQLTSYNYATKRGRGDHYRSGKSSIRPLKPMPGKKESQQKSESTRPPFLTIDDAIQEAERLTAILRELGEQKYPLDIRRGVVNKQEGIAELTVGDNDVVLKAGAKTYVFDIKQARNGTSYLAISEKRGGEQERGVIYIFAEHARAFSQAVSQMTMRLG